jgi:hypothetical protein
MHEAAACNAARAVMSDEPPRRHIGDAVSRSLARTGGERSMDAGRRAARTGQARNAGPGTRLAPRE